MTNIEERLLLETYRIRDSILVHALARSAGVFYNINITRNKVPGTMLQVLNGVEYSINEQTGLPENCDYTEVLHYWGKRLTKEQQPAYFAFFALEHLLECYKRGEKHLSHQYWTSDMLDTPMLAEQHLIMYEDLVTGDIAGVTYILDLTNPAELRAREAEQRKALELALEKAEYANEAKTNFLFNISHDIRTPMNAILGFNEIAKKKTQDPEILDALEKAALAGKQMLGIINDILDMSRIQNGALKLNEEVINVKKHVNEIDVIHRQLAEAKGIHFILTDETVTPYVYGDASRISQITSNLMSNAIKFTPKGGTVAYHIKEVPVEEEGYAGYEIRVKDTGIGMSEEFQADMYKVFERERNAMVSGIQGTGLGLAIVKRIVESMGGEITCKSRMGEGTEFLFAFRLRTALTEEKEEECPEINYDLQNKRILLVEDIDLNREIAMEVLRAEGCIIEEAENGEQAVSLVLGSEPGYYDAVLMDIQMPVMDGHTAARKIRSSKNQALAEVPIIAMTANAFEEDKRKALDAGMNEHIAKPIDTAALKQVLAKILNK